MDLGKIIKHYRNIYHFTQSEVAELSGINEKYIGRLERNESVPTIDKAEQLCIAFDMRLCDFLLFNPKPIEPYRKNVYETDCEMIPKTIYYCNCCGCTFEAKRTKDEEIDCPECGCAFDEKNGYVERYIDCFPVDC